MPWQSPLFRADAMHISTSTPHTHHPTNPQLRTLQRKLRAKKLQPLPHFARQCGAYEAWRVDPNSLTPWVLLAVSNMPSTGEQVAIEAALSDASASGAFLLWICCQEQRQRLIICIDPKSNRWQRDAGPARSLPNERALIDALTQDEAHPIRLANCAAELARKHVTHRFYRDIQRAVRKIAAAWTADTVLSSVHRHELALMLVARLMFLYFVQSKNWLPHKRYLLELADKDSDSNYRNFWRPLFFDALNLPPDERISGVIPDEIPYLNGGLFAESQTEARHPTLDLPNALLCALIVDVFERYSFVDDEHEGCPQAVAPQLLGEIFEGLMQPDERRKTGAFYTPHPLALTVWQAAFHPLLRSRLGHALTQKILARDDLRTDEADALLALLWTLRVLDPAVGTGAFLLTALLDLEALALYAQRYTAGKVRTRRELREHWITHSLHGIDLQRNAVLLAELRLWLSVTAVSENDRAAAKPLPNLEHRVRVGNALLPPTWSSNQPRSEALKAQSNALADQLQAFPTLRGAPRRRALDTIHQLEAQLATDSMRERLQSLETARRAQLHLLPDGNTEAKPSAEERALRAAFEDTGAWRETGVFDAKLHFADVMREGGFDIIVGNPPWGQLSSLSRPMQRALQQRYLTLQSGGARQASPDMSVAFFEASLPLLAPDGRLSFLFPAKTLRAGWGKAWRTWVERHTHLTALEELSTHSTHGFKAAVYPSICVLQRPAPNANRTRIPLRSFLEPPPVYRKGLRPLATFFRVRYGVKTGGNAAFMLPLDATLRHAVPAVRGKDLRPFEYIVPQKLLFLHDLESGRPLATLDGESTAHLEPFRERLLARTDLRETMPWWAIFRVRRESLGWRVAWRDVAQKLEAVVLPPVCEGGPLNLNSTYAVAVASQDDARALCAWLNTARISEWLTPRAQRARNGYFRFDAGLVSQAPIPEALFETQGPLRAHALSLYEIPNHAPTAARWEEWEAFTARYWGRAATAAPDSLEGTP